MLTQARLKETLSYDPITGAVTWKVRTSNRVKVGDPAGYLSNAGYLVVSVDGQDILLHRAVFLMHHGYLPDVIDHRDRVKVNNRIKNLRDATPSGNQHNRGMDPRNTSGVKGVYWDRARQKWHAQICVDWKTRSLGRYATLEEAETVVRKEREKLHGEFANHD